MTDLRPLGQANTIMLVAGDIEHDVKISGGSSSSTPGSSIKAPPMGSTSSALTLLSGVLFGFPSAGCGEPRTSPPFLQETAQDAVARRDARLRQGV